MKAVNSGLGLGTTTNADNTLATLLQTRRLSNPSISQTQPLALVVSSHPLDLRPTSTKRQHRHAASTDLACHQLVPHRPPETCKSPNFMVASSPEAKSPKRSPQPRPWTGSLASYRLRRSRETTVGKCTMKALLDWTQESDPVSPLRPRLFGIRGHTSRFQPRNSVVLKVKPVSQVRILTVLPCIPVPKEAV